MWRIQNCFWETFLRRKYLSFSFQFELLKLMLSQLPAERPTTIGIRSRPPLGYGITVSNEWHFELPPRRRDSHISGLSSTSSILESTKSK